MIHSASEYVFAASLANIFAGYCLVRLNDILATRTAQLIMKQFMQEAWNSEYHSSNHQHIETTSLNINKWWITLPSIINVLHSSMVKWAFGLKAQIKFRF